MQTHHVKRIPFPHIFSSQTGMANNTRLKDIQEFCVVFFDSEFILEFLGFLLIVNFTCRDSECQCWFPGACVPKAFGNRSLFLRESWAAFQNLSDHRHRGPGIERRYYLPPTSFPSFFRSLIKLSSPRNLFALHDLWRVDGSLRRDVFHLFRSFCKSFFL